MQIYDRCSCIRYADPHLLELAVTNQAIRPVYANARISATVACIDTARHAGYAVVEKGGNMTNVDTSIVAAPSCPWRQALQPECLYM